MSTETVHAHHMPTLTTATVATLALAATLAAGVVVVDRVTSDGPAVTPAQVVPAAPPAPIDGRFGGPDVLERSLTTRSDAHLADPRYYGSPDAAERILAR